MPDNITFKDTSGDGIFARAIWAALCEEASVFEALGIIAGSSVNSSRPLTIECKVNGIEISLKGYLERLERHLEERVNKRAKELLEDYLSSKHGTRINTMSQLVEKFEKQMIAEFFPNDPDFNDR